MDADIVINILIALMSAAFAAGGAYAAVKVELRFINEKIERNRADITENRTDNRHDHAAIHDRISRLNERMTKAGINGPAS